MDKEENAILDCLRSGGILTTQELGTSALKTLRNWDLGPSERTSQQVK